jgi:DNA-binding NtrC family response regulator
MPEPIVLVVDDRPNMLSLLRKVLSGDAAVRTADCGRAAIEWLEREPVAVVVCDLRMPDMEGLEVLRHCKRLRPGAEFILMTAYASVATAVEALRLGAHDYITKPFEPDTLRSVVLRALGRAASSGDPAEVEEPGEPCALPGVLGRSGPMRELTTLVRRIAQTDSTVLVLGETGTGKERVARAIHSLGPRSSQRFMAVNCAAIPAELLESELFGHARGAFTGAVRDRAGLFEEADQGTLFLDEIGDLRLSLQAKLTRAIEERAIRRLGESRERNIDVRLVTATHRDLGAMVGSGTFREDLWYRLNVAMVRIPPLRDRREDIALLAAHFLRERAGMIPDRKLTGFAPGALATLSEHAWPGNVRQLRSAVERACIVASGPLVEVGDLPEEIQRGPSEPDHRDWADLGWQAALERGRDDTARRYLRAVIERFGGRVAEAAAHAGIERESFYRLLRRYGVRPEQGGRG